MTKIIKSVTFLTTFCLLGFVINAAIVLPDGTKNTQDEITAACGGGDDLRRVDCGETRPIYACRKDGKAEVCVEFRDCPTPERNLPN